MSVEFEPTGKEATHSFLIDNAGGEKIAVQVSMAKREIDFDGKETNPEAQVDAEFIVYPPQLVLGPNEKRTVRVTWTGDAQPKRELAYRIIAEQLPVDAEKRVRTKNTVIKMLLRYLGAVYITPRDAKAALVPLSAERVTSKDGKTPELALTFENKGNAHRVLKDFKIKVSASGKALELSEADVKPLVGQNILAGSKRRFRLAWPKELPRTGDLKFEITKQN